jgi:2'-5' RNA ligase
MARQRQPLDATRWLRVIGSYESASWTVTGIDLVESHLGQGARRRPRYEHVAGFDLGTSYPPLARRDISSSA